MTNSELKALLAELDASEKARAWMGERDLATAWSECERVDWLLWLASRMIGREGWPSHQDIVIAACACAETALVHVPQGEERPRIAIETTRKWARGEATLKEVEAAAWAAEAAARAAAEAAWAAEAAETESLKTQADIVRSILKIPV